MSGYPASMAAHGPLRSLEQLQRQLRGERVALLLAQMEAEQAGCDRAAEHCRHRIEAIDARLRTVDAARAA